MKVRELIAALKSYDENAEVIVRGRRELRLAQEVRDQLPEGFRRVMHMACANTSHHGSADAGIAQR